jgi:hypothetical protein
MENEKKSLMENIADDLACTAYAESGEPCPIEPGEPGKKGAGGQQQVEAGKKSAVQSVADDLACTAFAESGEPCPIDADKE